MIDTHCHLTFDGLHGRVDGVIADARAAGVDRMITVGTTPDDARKALALAERFDGVYATAGLHPHYATEPHDDPALRAAIEPMLAHPRLVALGEMGLDWHYPDPPRRLQLSAFESQLALAVEHPDLPIIIHNREATDNVLAAIGAMGLPGERFVYHCFTGSAEELDKILATGAMVSFTGIVTFKSAADLAEASDRVPMDRLMIETDSPYLTPEPFRKVRPNEPRYVRQTAEFLAGRRGMSLEDFTMRTDANAMRFFGLHPQ